MFGGINDEYEGSILKHGIVGVVIPGRIGVVKHQGVGIQFSSGGWDIPFLAFGGAEANMASNSLGILHSEPCIGNCPHSLTVG